MELKAVLGQYELFTCIQKYKGPFSIDYRERGFHARGVYLTQYTLRMGTPWVKQEEDTDTRLIANVRNMALCGEASQTSSD